MNQQNNEATVNFIGTVYNKLKQTGRTDTAEIISEIVITPKYAEGLYQLEDFSHIMVFFWLHLSNLKPPLKVHPRSKPENPLIGVFATRSPSRPNPVGVTTVELLEHKDNMLRVKGLDAICGTPVIDIKPYIPRIDLIANPRVPEWIKRK